MLPDIIDPLDGLFGRLRHGTMHRFTISRHADYSARDVELILRQYGIRIWGREMDSQNEFAVLVKQRQAVWAEYLLCRAGVPITGQLLDARNESYWRDGQTGPIMPKPWQTSPLRAHSFVDHVIDWIDRLFG